MTKDKHAPDAPARASPTAAKTIDEQIRDCEACIDRVKLASERIWQAADGSQKRWLDADECRVLSQLANAESRAHGELRELRIAKGKQPPGDVAAYDFTKLTPDENATLLALLRKAQPDKPST